MRDALAVEAIYTAQNTLPVDDLFTALIRAVRDRRQTIIAALEELVVPEAIDSASHQLLALDKLLSHLAQGQKNWQEYQAYLAAIRKG